MSRSPSETIDLDGVVAPFPGWALIEVEGSHRERFLSSQVTSDLTGLAEGGSQLSTLLDRTGRLQAFFFLHRGANSIHLLAPEAVAAHCVDRLENHIIADDVTIRCRETGPMRLALGPAAVVLADSLDPDEGIPVAGWGGRGFVTWNDGEIELSEMSPDEIAARQILCGPPVWGRDVQPDQLINETSLLDAAVSFDKGCFLGQETVAKVASHRGAVRAPVLLDLVEPDIEIDGVVGEWFGVGNRDRAGQILSETRWEDRSWLQVSLHRELRIIGRQLSCLFADGRVVDAEIRAIPLLPPPSREEMADRLTVAASVAFGEDRTDRALELLERATTLCPSWADAYESMGVILGRLGRHDEAIEQMNRLLEVEPSSVMGHSNLSLFHNQLGNIEAAEEHLALATRASFAGATLSESSAKEHVEADRQRRAEMFRQVLEIDPEDALAHFGMGELLVEQSAFRDAVVHLERAIASDPGHSAAMLALGTAFEGLDDHSSAFETYERGVEIAAKKGDLATAQKMQERITALASQTP